MRFLGSTVLAIATLWPSAQCMTMSGRNGHGLVGYGIDMYFPTCCSACRSVLSASQLNCSEVTGMDMPGMDMGDSSFDTSPECFATDDAFLQSLALCISQRCPTDTTTGDLKDWQIEQWWQQNVAGRLAMQPDPKETYGDALSRVQTTPTEIIVAGDPLDRTILVSEEDYQSNWNANVAFEQAEDIHERYALVVLLSGVVIPVAFSLLRFVPFPSRWTTLFNMWFIDPPAFGRHHKTPICWGLTNMPTRGQAFLIMYLVSINIILCAVGYNSRQPNAWFADRNSEILTYITNRTGVLSFANIPLLILYAGRNNMLLWLTNWSHGTFVLLHRYIAGIATLQAIIHSVIYLYIYVADSNYSSTSNTPFWYWGAIATVGMSILLPTSILPIRRMIYEAFLLWHIVISVFVVVGCYLHINRRFGHQWGYEVWIYVAMAVWAFDRLLRVARLVRNGLRWARISIIDEDYMRIDIDGIGGNGHAYLYFPTLTWRIWENHPFSVTSTILSTSKPSVTERSQHPVTVDSDVEKRGTVTIASTSVSSTSSVKSTSPDQGQGTRPPRLTMSFLLRTRGGLTSLLRSCSHTRIPVFVESQYGTHPDLSHHPTLICVVGGVGITAVVPLLRSHPGRTKLLWGVRTPALVDAMSDDLAGIDKEVFIGRRTNVYEQLDLELEAEKTGKGPVVMVSGPHGMADDVRNAVCEIARRKKNLSVRLVEESFSW